MKVIIQVVQHIRPGGIEIMVLDFLQHVKQGETVWLVSLEGTQEEALLNWPRLVDYKAQLIFLNKPNGWHFASFIRLYRLFKAYQPDVVHTHHIGPLIYAGSMARLKGVSSIIHTEHDAWHLNHYKRRLLQKLAIRLARPIVVADAETVAVSLQHRIGLSPKVIKNGIDCNRFKQGNKNKARKQYRLSPRYQLIGTAGRLERVKSQSTLISAMHYLPKTVHLVIAGVGSEENNLKQQVQLMQLDRRIHFLGLVDDMPTFYQALDVFCLPSLSEGLPLSLLEAQACNVPVVATDVGGVSEAVCPKSGKLVSVDEASNLAQTISQSLAEYKAMTHAEYPRNFVLENGNLDAMHLQYRDLWSS